MKARRLRISPELWVEFLKNETPVTLRVSKNALPADAKCVHMEPEYIGGTWAVVALWIESTAFRDDDPDDLPDPYMTLVAPLPDRIA